MSTDDHDKMLQSYNKLVTEVISSYDIPLAIHIDDDMSQYKLFSILKNFSTIFDSSYHHHTTQDYN